MTTKPAEEPISSKSLLFLRNPELVPNHMIAFIARNGFLYKIPASISYLGALASFPLYQSESCPHCGSTLGYLALHEGSLVFLCGGISCLLKTIA